MADPVSPPVAASVPALLLVPAASTNWAAEFFSSVGLDYRLMFCGLLGVVISQTLLKRTAVGWGAIASLATGSMLLASITAPLLQAALPHLLPDSWAGLFTAVPGQRVGALCAAAIGGFAQPGLMLACKRWLPQDPQKDGS